VILDQEAKPIELVVTKNGSEKKLTIVTPMGGVPIFSEPVPGTGKNLQEVLDDATADEGLVLPPINAGPERTPVRAMS
jgi:hypothetical protein